jgi:hypothetical protein
MRSETSRKKTRVSASARHQRASYHRVSQASFKRQDVEWILWRTLSSAPTAPIKKAFAARIKAVLDLDRLGKFRTRTSAPGLYAFRAAPPAGPGSDAEYKVLDVVCLWIAMQLMDMGLKPSPVVFLLRHARRQIGEQLLKILYQQNVFLLLTRAELGTICDPSDSASADTFGFRIVGGALESLVPGGGGTARCIALQLDFGCRRLVSELDGVLRRRAGHLYQ